MPTSTSRFTTSKSSVVLGGITVGDHGVTGGGVDERSARFRAATGTDHWLGAVPERPGRNVITITAVDADSNRSSIHVSIYRTAISRRSPPVGPRSD